MLLNVTCSAGLHQVCRSATRLVNGQAPSFLDLVFVTNVTKILSCEVYPGLSGCDHLAIETHYAITLPRKGKFARAVQNFHQTDHAHLAQLAHLTPW
ncbi:hypothetical protein HPB48_002199 [Haemaphysalis longicornis]|uniref:Uncharacterized protein n=1 Tax=Haemaphysalis longicornis TaxID=44386 RepID=A0A9J6FGT3_HAELO|nr:hypothetical protein HPB48_002199 [Haemaphysalis longicornis]